MNRGGWRPADPTGVMGVVRSVLLTPVGTAVILCAIGTSVTLLTGLGFAGRWLWIADLATHFRSQYLVVATATALALARMRYWRTAGVFGLVGLLNLAGIAPLYLAPSPAQGAERSPAADGPRLRAILINVNTANRRSAAVIAHIRERDPDLIVLLEVNRWWLAQLGSLGERYPHQVKRSREDNFGIAVYSRVPMADVEILDLGGAHLPSVRARLDLDPADVTLIATHHLPPVSTRYAQLRDAQLAAIAPLVRAQQDPVVVLGDLNASPWSNPFVELLERSGLRQARRGFGVAPTWPAPIPLLWIPIDHCLVTRDLQVVHFSVGTSIGSDHYPVEIELRVLRAAVS